MQNYLPMQNEEKMECRMVSEVMRPVMQPMWWMAVRISSARRSDEIELCSADWAAVRAS